MAGPIVDLNGHGSGAFPTQDKDDDNYLPRPSTCVAPAEQTNTTTATLRRPKSARNGRPTSPIFSRWSRRHQSHHGHRHHSGQLHAPAGRGSTEGKVSGSGSIVVKQPPARSRANSLQKRQSHIGTAGGVPQMTREEFEALPLAIQRKYFSTLERLRFARDSGHVEGISQHYDDISHFKRRKQQRQGRSVSEQITGQLGRRQSLRESPCWYPDPSPSCSAFPEQTVQKGYSREEQLVLARQLRASVILDAADEAICKLNRRTSKKFMPDANLLSPSVPSVRTSMDSHIGSTEVPANRQVDKDIPQSFYDTFRWLDEEEDLDLRLFLDDYHANLRDDVPSPSKQQRPSFRRHLSISKIPFGRNSLTTSRPTTKDEAMQTPGTLHSPVGSTSNFNPGGRRKSRALSLITPKHTPQDSVTAFDPAAAHYQDPEARLKLRVYLASPQKFDEAIEFGFPSADVLAAAPVVTRDGTISQPRMARQKLSDGSSHMRTFLADDDDDDNVSLDGDQVSLGDPDSPKTPLATEMKPDALRPLRALPTNVVHSREPSRNVSEGGGYAQAPASSREMTLRMTLTRPDLRAHEEQIYGWQQQQQQQGAKTLNRKSTTLPPTGAENITYVGTPAHPESMDKVAGFDWNSVPADRGVMKRFWNRVRRV